MMRGSRKENSGLEPPETHTKTLSTRLLCTATCLRRTCRQVSASSAMAADSLHAEESFQESPTRTHLLQGENWDEQLPMHLQQVCDSVRTDPGLRTH